MLGWRVALIKARPEARHRSTSRALGEMIRLVAEHKSVAYLACLRSHVGESGEEAAHHLTLSEAKGLHIATPSTNEILCRLSADEVLRMTVLGRRSAPATATLWKR